MDLFKTDHPDFNKFGLAFFSRLAENREGAIAITESLKLEGAFAPPGLTSIIAHCIPTLSLPPPLTIPEETTEMAAEYRPAPSLRRHTQEEEEDVETGTRFSF